MKRYLFWPEVDYLWTQIAREDGFMLWPDIALIEEVKRLLKGGSGAPGDLQKEYEEGNPWRKLSENLGEEKAERFIKIFCTVNDVEYEKGKFIKENIKVSVSQIDRVFDETIKVKVEFQK